MYDILDKLELEAKQLIKMDKETFHDNCKDCHMYEDCKYYEHKTGNSLCEVVIHPYFGNPHKKDGGDDNER